MIDFDQMDGWVPHLTDALSAHVSESAKAAIAHAAPRYIEDSRNLLFKITDRDDVIDATLNWIGASSLMGYHGSRLNDDEVSSVRAIGLTILRAENRRVRLKRALSKHANWSQIEAHLDEAIRTHGEGKRAGGREDQAHLTLSRHGLVDGFNHYLTHGSEFDQHVAHALSGKEGEDLLRRDGQARLISFAVPGASALEAAHPHFTIADKRNRGETPNIVGAFLEAWSYRLAHPNFQCRTLGVDCGMVFHATIPSAWIANIETLPV